MKKPAFDLEDDKLDKSVEEPEHSSLLEEEPKAPELSEEDRLNLQYQRDMEEANIKDAKMVENLFVIREAGYLNFKINHEMLKRNNNDIVIAINNLCNGIVSESMF